MEALEATGPMSKDEIAESVELVKKIAEIVSQEFKCKNLQVIDGKFELGRLKYRPEQIVLIDEICPDGLRVCKGTNNSNLNRLVFPGLRGIGCK
jgi:phosphoribosylaminoimidazole-succinocarboxamide synthase